MSDQPTWVGKVTKDAAGHATVVLVMTNRSASPVSLEPDAITHRKTEGMVESMLPGYSSRIPVQPGQVQNTFGENSLSGRRTRLPGTLWYLCATDQYQPGFSTHSFKEKLP